MARRYFIGAFACLILGGLATSHQLFADKPQKPSKAKSVAPQSTSKPVPLSQQFPLKVAVDSSLPGAIKESYQRISSYINNARIPTSAVRNNYFRAHSDANSPEVIGWNAVLMNVEETPEGFLAKLRVYAHRKGVIDSLYYYEYYLINGRGVHFVETEHEPVQPRDVIGI